MFSVNLAFGVLDLNLAPGIEADPTGGGMGFFLRYRSALAFGNVSSPGLPAGWTHNWDYRIVPLDPGTWGPLELVYPNGASEQITPVLSNGSPTGAFFSRVGAPYVASGVPSSVMGSWSSISLSQTGYSQQIFTVPTGDSVYRLTTEVHADGSQTCAAYSGGSVTGLSESLLGGSTNPNGSTLSMGYSGGLLQYVFSGNGSDSYSYDAEGRLASVGDRIDPAPLWSFSYTQVAGISLIDGVTTQGKTAGVTYDPVYGTVNSMVDANNNLRDYAFTGTGPTSVVVGAGSLFTNNWAVTPDFLGRVIAATDAAGNKTAFTYSSSAPGSLSSILPPTGSQTSVSYDSSGNPTVYKAAYGNSTVMRWAYPAGFPLGQLTQVQEVGTDGSTKAPTTYAYYPAGDANPGEFPCKLRSVTRPNGGVTTYTYTALGNVATITVPTATAGQTATTSYSYTGSGEYGLKEAPNRPTAIRDPLGRVISLDYDGNDRLYSVTDPFGNNVSINFNAYNQPASITLPGQVMAITYPGGDKPPTSATITAPGGYVPNSLFQNYTDNEYAPSSSLGVTGGDNANSITRDPQYGLNALTDGAGSLMHTFMRNWSQNSFQYTMGSQQNAATWTSQLDKNGYLTSFTTPRSTGTSLTAYDLLQSVSITGPGPNNTTTSLQNEYAYDAFGRVASAIGAYFIHFYSYDDEDNVISDAVGLPGNYFHTLVQYTYGPNGARNTMALPSGVNISYGYDPCGNMRVLSFNNPADGLTHIVNYEYDADNRVTAAKTESVSTYYTYNVQGLVSQVLNLTPAGHVDDPNMTVTDPVDNQVHSVYSEFWNIAYDAYGERTSMNYRLRNLGDDPLSYSAGTTNYSFEQGLASESWATEGQNPVSVSYEADNAGNVVSPRGASLPVDRYSDELLGGQNVWGPYSSMSYDASGNVLTFNGITCFYDPFEELSNLTTNSNQPYLYLYDEPGHRLEKIEGGNYIAEGYTYDGDSLVCSVPGASPPVAPTSTSHISESSAITIATSPSATIIPDATTYIWGPTGVIAETYSNLVYTDTFDPNGSAVGRVGYGSHDVPDVFDAYGKPVWAFSPEYPGLTNSNNNNLVLGYKGQFGYITDPESGLIYCHHRYYDPAAARWVSRDPTGLDGGINPYEYCDGDPLDSVDPSGLQQGLNYGIMSQSQFQQFCRYFDFHNMLQVDAWWRHTSIEMALNSPGPGGDECRIIVGVHRGDFGMVFSGAFGLASMFSGEGDFGEITEVAEGASSWRAIAEAGGYPTEHVIGKFPGYIDQALESGGKFFSMGDRWNKETGWASNIKSLDRSIARRLPFRLSYPETFKKAFKGNFELEIRYLEKHGYVMSKNKRWMRLP
jgi:RHS repeat-associated protein